MPQRYRAGLTLIEIMVALIVMSILASMAFPAMSDLMDRRRVIATADEVAGIINYAKAETNAVNLTTLLRFDIDPNSLMSCVVVTDTTASTNTCNCTKAPESLCSGSSAKVLRLFQQSNQYVSFKAFADTWGGFEAQQTRIQRDLISVTATGLHIDVEGKRGNKLTVQVSGSGKVRVCSPDGKMNGYTQCVATP